MGSNSSGPSIGQSFCLSFQAVRKRMDKQGAHRTYSIPKRYKDQFHMVQNSQTPVVWIMDVDATKIGVGVKQTTLSGK